MVENEYQIETYGGIVIDRSLSYEEALVYLEDPKYRKFCLARRSKECDQNDRYSM